MVTHTGGWGIFAVGGLYLTLTSGVALMQNPFFFQSVVFLIIAFAFYAKRAPDESEAVG
jgi:hypothetical protein